MEGMIEKEVNFIFMFKFHDNFRIKFHDIFKVEFIFSRTKKNVKNNDRKHHLYTVPIFILMLKSMSGHGKGKGGKGNQKSNFKQF